MTLDEYQDLAVSTCMQACYCDEYLDLGYIGEVGELAGKLAKIIRGDVVKDVEIMHELGDIAWFIAVKARLHDERVSLVPVVTCFHDSVYNLLNPAPDAFNLKMSTLRNVCEKLGFDFYECLELNVKKLADRRDRGTIIGSGDNR